MLNGLAGSGKTELLQRLAAAGESVVDLEALARHRGSAFGAFGQPPQPSHATFQTAVRAALAGARSSVWVEDEGDYLGSVGLPPELIASIATAACVEVVASRAERVARLVATYAAASEADWLGALDAISTRFGDRAEPARAAVRRGDVAGAVDVLLDYYDNGYRHRVAALDRPVLARVHAGIDLVQLIELGG